jgi:hypothetical protein
MMAEERRGLFRGMRERAAKNAMPTPGVDMSRGLTPEQAKAMSEGKPLPKRTPPKRTPSDPDIAGMADMKVEAEPFRMEGEAPSKVEVTGVDRDKAPAESAPTPAPADTQTPAFFARKGDKIRFSPAVDPYVYEYDPQTKTYTIVAGPQGVGATFGPDHSAIAKFDAAREEALQQSGQAIVPTPLKEARARRAAQEAEGEAPAEEAPAESPFQAAAQEGTISVSDARRDRSQARADVGAAGRLMQESVAQEGFFGGNPAYRERLFRRQMDSIDRPANIDSPLLPRGVYADTSEPAADIFERQQAADEYTERTQALKEDRGEMSRLQRMLVDEVKANMQKNAPPGTQVTDEEVLALLDQYSGGPTREEDEEAERAAMSRMLGF